MATNESGNAALQTSLIATTGPEGLTTALECHVASTDWREPDFTSY
jgi:hypothetical protein